MNELVRRAQQEKDAEAFILLMEENRQSMLKVAKSYLSNEEDVADVMQDVIVTCYEKLDTLRQPQFFKTWLIRIVINKCKDLLRSNRSYVTSEVIETAAPDTTEEDLEFMELLGTIDEKYRTILILYYVEGFNTREIAGLLDLNEHTVKSRLIRARKKFEIVYRKEVSTLYG